MFIYIKMQNYVFFIEYKVFFYIFKKNFSTTMVYKLQKNLFANSYPT